MQLKHSISALALATTLFACGGGGSDTETPGPTPKVNQAPTAVADSVTSINGSAITVDALSNDSDPEGDVLTVSDITVQPTNGVVTLTDNTIVYAPNAGFYGSDSFTYTITDGEFTSQAQVDIQNSLALTLSGVVTDSPLANANVKIRVNGLEFETTTNSIGEFQIDIPLDNTNGYIFIEANGTGPQSGVSLFSYLGAISDVVESAKENGVVDESVIPNTRVTQLTTAEYLLAQNDNTEAHTENSPEFAALLKRDNASELLEVAAFIKLIVDNPAYSLETDQTLSDFFASSQTLSPRKLIEQYFYADRFVNESGFQLLEVYEDINAALIESAAQRVIPFDADALVGKTIAYANGDIQDGFLPSLVDLYAFESAESGTFFQADDFWGSFEYPFTWQISDGKILISFDADSLQGNESFPNYTPFNVFRFGEEAVAKADEIDRTVGFPAGQLYVRSVPGSQTLTIFSTGEDELVFRELIQKDILRLNDGEQDFFYEDLIPELVTSKTIRTNVEFDSSVAAMSGDWILHYNYEYVPDIFERAERISNQQVGLNADKVTLSASGEATGQLSDLMFSWATRENGEFSYTVGNTEYIVKPFFADENGFLAMFESYENGEKTKTFVKKLYRTDPIDSFELSSMTTEYPNAYVSLVSAGFKDSFEDGLLRSDLVFSYQFNQDDGVKALSPFYDPIDELRNTEYFGLNFDGRAQADTSGDLRIIRDSGYSYQERGWRIFKVVGDRVWFIRTRVNLSGNGESETNDFARGFILVQPRISSAMKVDLSRYGEIWDRTLELGIVD
ncbi:MAG: hypothetical protein Alis3KO_32950 [Aliiglaciecola sp.]